MVQIVQVRSFSINPVADPVGFLDSKHTRDSRKWTPQPKGGLYRLLNLARRRKIMAVIHAEDARLDREVIRQTDNAGTLENVARCRPWFSETALHL